MHAFPRLLSHATRYYRNDDNHKNVLAGYSAGVHGSVFPMPNSNHPQVIKNVTLLISTVGTQFLPKEEGTQQSHEAGCYSQQYELVL
jgi:hypothetical protein